MRCGPTYDCVSFKDVAVDYKTLMFNEYIKSIKYIQTLLMKTILNNFMNLLLPSLPNNNNYNIMFAKQTSL